MSFFSTSPYVFAHGSENHDGELFVIQMTDAGFKPQEFYITEGDTISFENVGTNDHWPASNVHPTHDLYPDFDPQKPIIPGHAWQFTFEKSGTWDMHDHLFPEFTGRIVVTSHDAPPKNTFLRFWDWITSMITNLLNAGSKTSPATEKKRQ